MKKICNTVEINGMWREKCSISLSKVKAGQTRKSCVLTICILLDLRIHEYMAGLHELFVLC